ncbi:MAG: multicomponent Na+:H+ antiporter subunit MnhD [Phormidium sp. OSCR]|nr:MAG: multicomponent Na+:H+ antiporter subunit MnhD [Phormidium sp. OSCR]
MMSLTIIWIALPLFIGLTIYLLPKLDRYLALATVLMSFGYGLNLFSSQTSQKFQLLDNFGVSFWVDSLSSQFILTNALVTGAVILYSSFQNKTAFFYSQAIILHGSVNAVFICADFMSLYVALEVIGVAAFLLVSYPRSDRALWVALRYLFVSNTSMLFYLIGAILVYQANHSFAFTGLANAPPEAIALIFLGLLSKGGVFVSGLWLPLTHSESESPVSALLSGSVVKAGVFPLLRCALLMDELLPVVQILGISTSFFGIIYALFEKDAKRILALSTISQLGWMMVAPMVAGVYALAHGLVKSLLFLASGALPTRDLDELQVKPMYSGLWLILLVGGLSMSGCPGFLGFSAKVSTLKSLSDWPEIFMNVSSVGTALIFGKFIFLPHKWQGGHLKPGLIVAALLLIVSLLVGNVLYLQAYSLANLGKALAVIGLGWLGYWLFIKRQDLKLPRMFEQFDNLIGSMSLVLIVLFWMVFT